MKKIMFMFFVAALSFSGFAQKTQGNTVSSKEVAPTWPGCEEKSNKSNCFNTMLAQHIQQNFHYPKDYSEKDKGTKLIVEFQINKNGKPEIKKVSEGRKSLQEAATKTILSIPEMKPGSLNGKPRAITYKIPFTF